MSVYLISFAVLSISYFATSGIFEYITSKMNQKIQPTIIPDKKQIKREIVMSLQTISIWSLLNCYTYNQEITGITFDLTEYSFPYHILSFFGCFIIHDTNFYWTHRLMHHPKIYPYFHKGHHLSVSPTAWCALAFQPEEALLQYIGFFMIPTLIFVNIYVFILYLLVDMVVNTAGHCGYEFVKNKIPFLNTVTHHDLHHKLFNKNYGAFFNIWDHVCGTLHH